MIDLNYRDSRPIYEQIRDGLRRLVVTGALGTGERIPSVRELAATLAINPNTIQRAYRELEAEGYIVTLGGRGSFVSEKAGIDEHRRSELLDSFDEAASELMYLGMTEKALAERLSSLREGKKL